MSTFARLKLLIEKNIRINFQNELQNNFGVYIFERTEEIQIYIYIKPCSFSPNPYNATRDLDKFEILWLKKLKRWHHSSTNSAALCPKLRPSHL